MTARANGILAMNLQPLDELAALIRRERDALLAGWREQVKQLPSAEHLDTPTLNDHVPALLEELAAALQSHSDETIPETLCEGSPPAHGLQRVRDGFDIVEVVAEYNILRGCIHDLADRGGLSLQGKPFHIVNRVFDGSIGLAVEHFARQQAAEVRLRREEYLSFVAHDLRTPLSAIALSGKLLELMSPSQEVGGEGSQVLKTLRRNVQRLEALVCKVLEENSHLEAVGGVPVQSRHVDLWPLVETLVHDLQPLAATSGTRLTNAVPDDLVVFADATLVTRILQNLMANAIRHAPGGNVTIRARQRDREGDIECSVSDDGHGIPEDLLAKVFDKGETGPQEGGTGLGLAIVKTFTEAHGGSVSVESKQGIGSTFLFSLPAATDSGG